MKKLALLLMLAALFSAGACNSKRGKTIKTAPAGNNLSVSLDTKDGVLKHGNTEFTLSFADTSGKSVDVGAVALTFHMPQMGTMSEMNETATLTTSDAPGVYRGRAKLETAGEWQVKITYEGSAGRGQASFSLVAQ